MEAFRPFLNFAKTSSNVSDIYPDESCNTESATNLEIVDIPQLHEISQNSEVRQMESLPQTPSGDKENKRRKSDPSTSVQDMIAYFESKRKRHDELDATDKVFLGHASIVKLFSPRRQIEVKMKISQIIMEYEMLHLEESTADGPSASGSSQTTSSISAPGDLLTTNFTSWEPTYSTLTTRTDEQRRESTSEESSAPNYFRTYDPHL